MALDKPYEPGSARDVLTLARMAGFAPAGGAGWAQAARVAAAARLRAQGLPLRRDEYWRYTDPAALTAPEPARVGTSRDEPGAGFAAIDRVRIVFSGGAFDGGASDDPSLAGVTIETLTDAAAHDAHWAGDIFGVLEAQGQTPVARPLAALTNAFAVQGVVIRGNGRASRPVELVYRGSGVADAMLHHVIRLDPGADLTLLESGTAGARSVTVIEADIGDGAALHHVRLQTADPERVVASHIFARLGANSLFKSFTLATDGTLGRNEVVVELCGDDGRAHLAGAVLGAAGCHHDDTVFVTHAAQRCESRQVFKKVLHDDATGVFQGKILVKPGAQKTDGYQISKALLLGDAAQFLAKPELEIYADDVKCSHGSTSGALDPTALFYLRSRGVPLAEARALLVLSFVADAVAEIDEPAVAAAVLAEIEGWLNRRHD